MSQFPSESQKERSPKECAGASRFVPLWGIGALVALSIVARFGLSLDWPLPQCWLRKLTGLPCPSCGCTRSLAAWAHLDLEQAFRFNPLFFCGCVILLGWLAMTLTERCLQRKFLPDVRHSLRRWPLWMIGLALVAANWLYLCLMLPK